MGYGGSRLATDYAKSHGWSASNQMLAGDMGGLTASLLGGGMVAKGPGMLSGMKESVSGAFEPGGMFGGAEPALAGGPGGFGSGAGPEIVPRAPGSPGMDAWNPPANDPMQMTGTGNGTPTDRLLPGEGDVGTYDDLNNAGSRGDDLTPHHMPSNKYMTENGPPGYTRDDGISMNMEQPQGPGGRHRLTASYGTDPNLAEYLDMSPRDALARDITDARQIYKDQDLYIPEIRQGLQQVIQANKAAWPGFFDK